MNAPSVRFRLARSRAFGIALAVFAGLSARGQAGTAQVAFDQGVASAQSAAPAQAAASAQSGSSVQTPGSAQGASGILAPVASASPTPARAKPRPAAGTALGRIVGKLTDAATGEALVGGQVGVKGSGLGNVSDDAGAYFINNVPLGKRTITVEYLGYEPQSREHTVLGGNANTVDFTLDPTPIAMDEILVEEVAIADLSEYVAKTPSPTFKATSMRLVEIEEPDTSAMADWHAEWRNFSALYLIEYPMLGQSVYFRRPAAKAPAGAR